MSDEWDDTDDDSWGDEYNLVYNDEELISIKTQNQQKTITTTETCWKCKKCRIVNNVYLMIRSYGSKCYGCRQVCYNSSQCMDEFESKYWDVPFDHKLCPDIEWLCCRVAE